MVKTIHDTVLDIFANPEVKKRLTEIGITHSAMSTADYTSFVAKSIDV